jgi:hypothetical protein
MAHLTAVETFSSCDGDGTLNFFKYFGHFLQQISLSFGRFLTRLQLEGVAPSGEKHFSLLRIAGHEQRR